MHPTEAGKAIAELKSYAVPWKGGVALACGRCQRKLRKTKHPALFAKVKKWMKKRPRRDTAPAELRVIDIPCQNICPKRGIVVCSPAQLNTHPARFSIIYSEEQMESFYNSLVLAASARQGAIDSALVEINC
jgi:hypothetical protein